MTVELIDYMGSDARVIDAMLISRGSEAEEAREMSDENRGRLNFLIKNRHASPFGHPHVMFYVETPIFVAREWMRHRTQSYNEYSMRYAKPGEGDITFYLPDAEEMRTQVGKPGSYRFEAIGEEEANAQRAAIQGVYDSAQRVYRELCEQGLARELARMVLPVGMMTKFYATASLRNWLNFLVLRNAPEAQAEIRVEAQQVEAHIERLFPVSHELWVKNGRPQL